MSRKENHIDYIELKATNLESTKKFFTEIFEWEFVDYGPEYSSFSNSGISGGFVQTEKPIINGVLIVLYVNNLEVAKDKILKFGGVISKDIFSFPGGRRFHFIEPSGNEFAVWSDK